MNLSKTDILGWLKQGLKDRQKYPEPTIVCAGIGGGGCNIVSELSRKRRNVVHYCLNTDSISNAKRNDIKYMNVGMEYILDNRDSGGHPEIARKVFKEEAGIIDSRVFSNADFVVLVVALGGGTGSGGVIATVKMLKTSNVPFRVYVVRPFEFEDNRKRVADSTLSQLRIETDQIEVFDNNEFQSLAEANRSIKEDIDSFIDSRIFFLEGRYRSYVESIMEEELDKVLSEREIQIDIEVEPVQPQPVHPQ
ncbi:MAG: hypothetical protein ACP5UO_05245 [Thermoplasmata archaeon]